MTLNELSDMKKEMDDTLRSMRQEYSSLNADMINDNHPDYSMLQGTYTAGDPQPPTSANFYQSDVTSDPIPFEITGTSYPWTNGGLIGTPGPGQLIYGPLPNDLTYRPGPYPINHPLSPYYRPTTIPQPMPLPETYDPWPTPIPDGPDSVEPLPNVSEELNRELERMRERGIEQERAARDAREIETLKRRLQDLEAKLKAFEDKQKEIEVQIEEAKNKERKLTIGEL